jgi:hypothetical protein
MKSQKGKIILKGSRKGAIYARAHKYSFKGKI